EAQENLALLMRRLGLPAIEVALQCYVSSDTELHGHAEALLRRFITRGRSASEGIASAQIAWRGAYLLVDVLIASPAGACAKAELLAEMIEACPDEATVLLLVNALLCYPDAAFGTLMARFWAAGTPEALYRSPDTLYALGRMGSRFAAALLD